MYACEKCGNGPLELPDFPQLGVTEKEKIQLPPEDKRVPDIKLQVDHIDKELHNDDLSNLQLLCTSCHKKDDLTTPSGVAKVGSPPTQQVRTRELTDTGYWIGFLDAELL